MEIGTGTSSRLVQGVAVGVKQIETVTGTVVPINYINLQLPRFSCACYIYQSWCLHVHHGLDECDAHVCL